MGLPVLRVVNALLFLVIGIQVVTGLAMLFEAPLPGELVIHKYNAVFVIMLVAVHIAFNWPWVKVSFFKRPGIRRKE